VGLKAKTFIKFFELLMSLVFLKNNRKGQALEAHAVILATWEAEIRRIMVPGHPRQKVH
jgi:hypothetical protein